MEICLPRHACSKSRYYFDQCWPHSNQKGISSRKAIKGKNRVLFIEIGLIFLVYPYSLILREIMWMGLFKYRNTIQLWVRNKLIGRGWIDQGGVHFLQWELQRYHRIPRLRSGIRGMPCSFFLFWSFGFRLTFVVGWHNGHWLTND